MNDQLTHLMEELKIPFLHPACPEDWKDWYHYILYDPVSRIRFLYNLCFTGRPESGYVTETCFLTLPRGYLYSRVSDATKMETFGFALNLHWGSGDLQADPLYYRTDGIRFSIKENRTFLSIHHPQSAISVNLYGEPAATPVYVPELAPYGNGFIGWGVIPGFNMEGNIGISGKNIRITDRWYCYHDRNFGRFNWGHIGWVWFVMNAKDQQGQPWTYVLHRSNDNMDTNFRSPILFAYYKGKLKKIFLGNAVNIKLIWQQQDEVPPVLPGAMASLFSGRSVRMPSQLIIRATDERDYVYLKMDVETHTELIVPDNEKKEYTFIKELSGTAAGTQFFGNTKSICRNGFFYGEHVH